MTRIADAVRAPLESGSGIPSWSQEDLQSPISVRFDRIAGAAPDRTALILGEENWSYQALEQASNQIAHGLQEQVGTQQAPVAILLDPGFSFFATYLGVLKSGNICLPLDPGAPLLRSRTILERAGVAAIVSAPRLTDQASLISSNLRKVEFDKLLADQPVSSPEIPLLPSDPAVLYITSGSTGEPKAVLRNHQNMLHHALTYSLDHRITPEDRQSFLYSVQSGASMPDMLGAFLNGASLLPFDLTRSNVHDLIAWLRASQISLFHLPIPLFRLVIQVAEDQNRLDDLRVVLVGGEAVFRTDIERGWSVVGEACLFVHQLASTETNYITRFIIDRTTKIDSPVVPVGYPARDKQVMILDTSGEPVATGEVGEITVRSRYLAQGYWKDAQMTRKKFHPDHQEPGSVLYHTGDLGRFDVNGLLHYIGRSDQQVRIRGHRVEISEVEAAIQALTGVRLSAVVASTDLGSGRRLAAYIVLEDPSVTMTLDRVRDLLHDSLPEYMLPSDLVLMDQLPRLPSGKIDRSTLPAPGDGRPELITSYIPSRNLYEQRLVGIWEHVLGIQPIGVRDTFFQLGGNSLGAMRLLATIMDEMGEQLPVASLLQASTIEQQALLLQTERAERPTARVIGIQTSGKNSPFFCVSPRTVDVLAYRDLALQLGREQPFYALYGTDMPERPEDRSRIEHEAATFIEDVRRITPRGPYQIGGYSHGGIVALEMARQLQTIGEEVALVVLLDVYGPDYRHLLPLIPLWLYRPLQVLRKLQKKVDEFLPWMMHHMRLLSTFSWTDRVRYLTRKSAVHLRWLLQRFLSSISRQKNHRRAVREGRAIIGRSYHNYQPQLYDGQVLLIRASHQPLGIRPDPGMGWGATLIGDVDIYEVPGYHDSILFRPRLEVLASLLLGALSNYG